MRTQNRENFEKILVIATLVVLVLNLGVFFAAGNIAMGVINTIVLAAYSLLFLVDWIS